MANTATVGNAATRQWLYLAGCAAALLVAALPAFSQASNNVRIVETAKRTACPLGCIVRDAATGKRIVHFQTVGTAFMLDTTGTFATAKHVIDELLAPPRKVACRSAAGFPVGGWKREDQEIKWFYFDAGVCEVNAVFDVAICRTTQDMTKQAFVTYDVADISSERPPDGTTVIFTGFPLQSTDPVSSVGVVAGFGSADNYNTMIVDKTTWPGASGSPIFSLDGRVVGMLTKTGTGQGTGLSFATVGNRIKSILAHARANWEKQSGQQKPE
jgi:S1-C subfamily serine protease